MQYIIKLILSLAIILTATFVAKKLPSLAGLIGVMPLTGALVLIWVYIENNGNQEVMNKFSTGAIFGIIPSIIFFIIALVCFKKNIPLALTLVLSFAAWLTGAYIHQKFLGEPPIQE